MKRKIIPLSILAIFSLSIGGVIFASSYNNNVDEAEAYSVRNVPTTIDLNATSDDKIIEYYSDLTELTDNQRSGTNLLKNLKPILKNGQKYFSYGSGATTAVWQAYEIVDRDWVKSPANEIAGYNSKTNVISGYTYGKSNSNVGSNPYIHALYVNRTAENGTRAWGDHSQTNYGINQEHVWAKSCGFDNDDSATAAGARGDLMHLWAGNGKVNGSYHSNYYYGYVDTTKKYYNAGNDYSYLNGNLRGYSQTLGGNVTVFEPQDSDKGDIARAIFYMAARYNYLSGSDSDGINASNPNLEIVDNVSSWSNSGYTCTTSTTGKMGILSDLLAWNRLDPPDEWEIHRNDILYTNFTNNRNPFIDYPEWADYIWGDKVGTPVDPNTNTIHAFSGGSGEQEDVNVESVEIIETATIKVGESLTISPSILPHNATNKSTTWKTSDNTVATVSKGTVTGQKVGSATITVTTEDQGLTDTCLVTVVAADTVNTSSDVLTAALTGVGDSYAEWSDVTISTGAVFAGQSMKNGSNEIQIRSSNNNSGIVSTTSPGKIKKVTVDWGSDSGNTGKTLDIYASNTAYTSPTQLYGNSIVGVKVGSIAYDSATQLTINDDYKYVGVRSKNGAIYLDSITFDWALAVSSVSLDINEIELDLYGDDVATLTATVLPENAANKNITWFSSDESVVTAEDGEITAVGVGDATITVTTEDGSKTATCAVTVVDTTPAESESVIVESSISAIASLNGWENSQPYGRGEANAISLDENVSFYTTGTTDNGKYYTKGNSWRLYYNGNGNIVIKASNDCVIKNVTLSFTISNSGVLSDSESHQIATDAVNEVNADSVTYTVTTGQIRINNISVEYELPGGQTKALQSISISNYKTTFTVGDSFVFGGVVTANYDNESSQNVTGSASFSGYDMSETGVQTITVSYTYKEVTRTATYQIIVQEVATSPYANGVKYKLFLHNKNTDGDYYFTGAMDGHFGATNANYSEGVYVYFEQNGSGQNLYFMDNETKNYITIVKNNTYYNFTISTETPTTAWHYSENNSCIYFEVNDLPYTIGTYNNYTTFSTFNLNTYPNNYKPQFAETAESFSNSLLNKITCDPTGNTSPIYHSGYSWSDLNDIYDVMDSSEQTILKTADANQYSEDIVEQAMAKYEFIAGKYSLNNFIAERTPKVFPSRIIYTDIKENRILLIVLIASILTGVSVGLFYIVKKNKKEL